MVRRPLIKTGVYYAGPPPYNKIAGNHLKSDWARWLAGELPQYSDANWIILNIIPLNHLKSRLIRRSKHSLSRLIVVLYVCECVTCMTHHVAVVCIV